LGAWSGATDDFDHDLDWPADIPNFGYAGIYHVFDGATWHGPTDFYRMDYRAPAAPDESKVWSPLYLWADPDAYSEKYMALSFAPDALNKPPTDRQYTLELLYLPPDLTDAPPVGTTWSIDADNPFTLWVPTFATYDGLQGYQFSFTMGTAAPEPTSVLGLGAALLLALRRR